jgi:lipopolysaccharide/colanic/teichoic acid biosynthesis glycosyltransferase
MKRLFDILASFFGLLLMSPVLLIFMLLVWRQDKHHPFYIAPRVGRGGTLFNMVKLRSMVKNADKTGVASTSAADNRITRVGHLIRKYKLDEFTQLWNVLVGDMSLVGPRPQVERAVNFYTAEERGLLAVRPGITDFASIVFSDEGDILKGHPNADLAYEQLIRPWKSRLGLFYIQHAGVLLDIKLCFVTVSAIVSKQTALNAVIGTLTSLGAPADLISISHRETTLVPTAPPGARNIVMSPDGRVE